MCVWLAGMCVCDTVGVPVRVWQRRSTRALVAEPPRERSDTIGATECGCASACSIIPFGAHDF